MTRLGLALISKNEEATLPILLASIEGAFDRVTLLDTGSTDDTVLIFREWAQAQEGLSWADARYEWRDDFADARDHAERLLLWGHQDAGPDRHSVPDDAALVDRRTNR